MPLFFVLAGYLFNEKKYYALGFYKFFKKKLAVYVIPYFSFCIINLALNMPIEIYNKNMHGSYYEDILYHLYWIVYSYPMSDKLPNCTPLWFLTSIFISNIYCYFLLKAKQRIYIFGISTFVFINALMYWNIPLLPWNLDIAMMGALFMLFGWYLRQKQLEKKAPVYILLLFSIASALIFYNGKINMGARVFQNEAIMIIAAGLMAYIILYISKFYIVNMKFIEYFGRNTLYLVAFNYAINTYSSGIWKRLPLTQHITYEWWMICIVDILVGYYIIRMFDLFINRFPKFKYFIGK